MVFHFILRKFGYFSLPVLQPLFTMSCVFVSGNSVTIGSTRYTITKDNACHLQVEVLKLKFLVKKKHERPFEQM
jgi:hypothetical protein